MSYTTTTSRLNLGRKYATDDDRHPNKYLTSYVVVDDDNLTVVADDT
jgi:hypothetical protein